MNPVRTDSFALGINNIARANRLPVGSVRDLENLVPCADGTLVLRPGRRRVLECVDCRFVGSVNERLVVVDAGQILSFQGGGLPVVIGSVEQLARVSGVLHNQQLYLSTEERSMRTDGTNVYTWAVPAPLFAVEAVPGGMISGRVRVAVTAVQDGVESGTTSQSVDVPVGSSIRVTSSDQRQLRVYISAADSGTPFYQGPLIGGAQAYSQAYDYQERLVTDGLSPLPHCEAYCSYNGVIVGRQGKHVFFTDPSYPHLMDPVLGFLQYPQDVTVIAPVDGGLYVVAGETYFVTGLETAAPSQQSVLDVDAVAGSECFLPDGKACWMTQYGPAIASSQGVQLPAKGRFSPRKAIYGASGFVEANGNQLVVTSLQGSLTDSSLMSTDWASHGDAT